MPVASSPVINSLAFSSVGADTSVVSWTPINASFASYVVRVTAANGSTFFTANTTSSAGLVVHGGDRVTVHGLSSTGSIAAVGVLDPAYASLSAFYPLTSGYGYTDAVTGYSSSLQIDPASLSSACAPGLSSTILPSGVRDAV